jgi:pimeloyl-ACP methyl ester carboxylesterase
MRRRSTRGAVIAAAFVAAAGCVDDGASGLGTNASVWKPCHDTFECTTVDVPVDYDAPNGPKIPLAVIRAPATNPEARIGAIVVNPGGLGAPVVDRIVAQYGTLRFAFARVFERFDVVAFDWRGVGSSAPLRCTSDSFIDEIRAAGLTLETANDVDQVERLRKRLADGCRAAAGDAMLENLHTENAARDLERVRQALGEPKLSYLGLSYGTLLGATYATMFPDRVRAFVLDAPVLLPSDSLQQIERRASSLDKALDRFFTACGGDAACPFHGGQGAPAVAQAFDAVLAKAARGEIEGGARKLSTVDAALAVTANLRADDRRAFAADLAKAEGGDGSGLLVSADGAAGKRGDGTYDGSVEGLIAIGALDLPLPAGATTNEMRTFLDGLRMRSRSARSASIPWSLAVDWPWRRRRAAPAISAKEAPPMLVVSTRYDPLAVHDDAVALVGAFANGSPLVTYEGDGHIAVLHSDCVRGIVTDWFLDPSVSPRATTCTAD